MHTVHCFLDLWSHWPLSRNPWQQALPYGFSACIDVRFKIVQLLHQLGFSCMVDGWSKPRRFVILSKQEWGLKETSAKVHFVEGLFQPIRAIIKEIRCCFDNFLSKVPQAKLHDSTHPKVRKHLSFFRPHMLPCVHNIFFLVIVNMNLIFCNFRNLECQFVRFPRSVDHYTSFSGFLSSPHSTLLSPIASDFYFAFNFHVSRFTLTLAIYVVRPVGLLCLINVAIDIKRRCSRICTQFPPQGPMVFENKLFSKMPRMAWTVSNKANWLITCFGRRHCIRFDYDTGVKQ